MKSHTFYKRKKSQHNENNVIESSQQIILETIADRHIARKGYKIGEMCRGAKETMRFATPRILSSRGHGELR